MDLRHRLAEARLYLCTDAREASGDLEDFLRRVLDGGVDVVQLRDKSLDAAREVELQALVARVTAEHDALWAVNDRADIAGITGAPVVHMGQDDLTPGQVRTLLGDRPLLGRSTHTFDEAADADADDRVDYFCVGPLWSTPTKPGRPAVGLDLLRRVAAGSPSTPWFAIGGIDDAPATSSGDDDGPGRGTRLDRVLEAGARRVVVVRAITRAEDPGAAAAHLRRRLEAA